MDRSSLRSASGSSHTVADTTSDRDIEAQNTAKQDYDTQHGEKGHHRLERRVPTDEQGAGPASATASGGDALSSHSRGPQDGNVPPQSNITIVNGNTEDEKSNLVGWDGPDDPKNPINFTETKKWTIMIAIGTATLACTCASSMVASTYEGMMEDFNVSREVATLSLTL